MKLRKVGGGGGVGDEGREYREGEKREGEIDL